MEQDLATLKAQLLALVAWADGSFDDDEKALFIKVLDASFVDDITRIELVDYLHHPPDRKEILDRLPSVPLEAGVSVIKVAYLIAHADGEFHETERQLFDDIMDRIGVAASSRDRFYEMLDLHYRSYRLEQNLIAELSTSG